MSGRRPDARVIAAILVTLTVAFVAVAALGARGFTEEAIRYLVRFTARLSVVLFVISFAWDDAASLILSQPVRRPPPNRAAYFVGFAVSHLFHLLALIVLGIWFPDPFLSEVEILTVIGGGLAYAAIFGIGVTFVVRGDRHPTHPVVHVALLYVWVVFARAYGFRLTEGFGYVMIVVVLVAAMVVRAILFARAWGTVDPEESD